MPEGKAPRREKLAPVLVRDAPPVEEVGPGFDGTKKALLKLTLGDRKLSRIVPPPCAAAPAPVPKLDVVPPCVLGVSDEPVRDEGASDEELLTPPDGLNAFREELPVVPPKPCPHAGAVTDPTNRATTARGRMFIGDTPR